MRLSINSRSFEALGREFRPTLRLALPLVFAEIGWMSMGVVDTIMVGRLPNSAVAIGATGLGQSLYHSVAIFGGGLLLGLDTFVAPTIIGVGSNLLLVAAAFQLFDGLQTVATGALRGSGDTRTPMVANFVAYWCIGLPLGYILCFRFGLGALGIWLGLCIGLMIIGSVLLLAWHRRLRCDRASLLHHRT